MTSLSAALFGNFEVFWPVIWLLLAAGACVTIDLAAKNTPAARIAIQFCALGGVFLALLHLCLYWMDGGIPRTMLLDGILLDQYGIFLNAGALVGAAICIFTSAEAVEKLRIRLGDYLTLVLLAATGMVLLAASNDLIMIFLSIELMSLAIYVLTGTNRPSGGSAEAAMKYFVMGAFASGFLLFGMALIYGVTGEIQLAEIARELAAATGDDMTHSLTVLGAALMLIGFAFKVGAVPFHQWVPDAYTGAPTPITGFMAVSVKIAAFAALGRFAQVFLGEGSAVAEASGVMLWALAALTMVLGNWLAVAQESVKRMLAYSSIAHSGYLLMGLAALSHGDLGLGAVLFYLIVYAFSTGGAFAVVTWCTGEGARDGLGHLRGLAWRRPGAALAMAVFMFSLAGIPLTGGFIGKYYLFSASLAAGSFWLTLIAICASIVGAYYYLRVVVYLYMKEPEGETSTGEESWGINLTLIGTGVMTIVLGLFPGLVFDKARKAAASVEVGKAATASDSPIAAAGNGDHEKTAFKLARR